MSKALSLTLRLINDASAILKLTAFVRSRTALNIKDICIILLKSKYVNIRSKNYETELFFLVLEDERYTNINFNWKVFRVKFVSTLIQLL